MGERERDGQHVKKNKRGGKLVDRGMHIFHRSLCLVAGMSQGASRVTWFSSSLPYHTMYFLWRIGYIIYLLFSSDFRFICVCAWTVVKNCGCNRLHLPGMHKLLLNFNCLMVLSWLNNWDTCQICGLTLSLSLNQHFVILYVQSFNRVLVDTKNCNETAHVSLYQLSC